MNYLPKNRFKNSYFKRIIALIVIFLSGTVLFSIFDSTLISSLSPLWKAENVVSRNMRDGVAFFRSQKALIDENAALKEKLSSLETEIMSLSKDRDERDTLLGLLGQRQNSKILVASVLAHPPQTLYDTIIIDLGSDNSVSLDSEVFLPEGPILGRVSEVFRKHAKVKLFSTALEETSAVLERGSVPVILVGVGAGNFKITIPRNVEVKSGDRILSADIFSRLLAVVGEVSVSSTDSFKEVLANAPINIFALRFVFVMP